MENRGVKKGTQRGPYLGTKGCQKIEKKPRINETRGVKRGTKRGSYKPRREKRRQIITQRFKKHWMDLFHAYRAVLISKLQEKQAHEQEINSQEPSLEMNLSGLDFQEEDQQPYSPITGTTVEIDTNSEDINDDQILGAVEWFKFVRKSRLSQIAIDRMLKMISRSINKNVKIQKSVYSLNKTLHPLHAIAYSLKYYCSSCQETTNDEKMCSHKNKNYLYTFSIKDNLKLLFEG